MIKAADQRRRTRHPSGGMIVATLALTLVCATAAGRTPGHPRIRLLAPGSPPLVHTQNRDIGKSAAAAAASKATGGRVLNVKRARGNGNTVYFVKVLLGGGKLRIVKVDGESGKVE